MGLVPCFCLILGCAVHDPAVSRVEESSRPSTVVSSTGPTASRVVTLPGGIECRLDSNEVLVPALIALDSGWIEQVACLRNTREHEAIFVTDVQPSLVHSALLMLSLEPGAPGRWLEKPVGDRYEIERIPPTGSPMSRT